MRKLLKIIQHCLKREYKKYSTIAKKGSKTVLKELIGNVDINKLENTKNTELYELVKEVGHTFNIKFKPHGIQKTTRLVGKIFQNVGLAADIGAIVIDVGEKIADNAQNKKIQEIKYTISTQVSDIANELSDGIREQYEEIENNLFTNNERNISKIKYEMISTAASNKKYVDDLKKYYADSEKIIQVIDLNSNSYLSESI